MEDKAEKRKLSGYERFCLGAALLLGLAVLVSAGMRAADMARSWHRVAMPSECR